MIGSSQILLQAAAGVNLESGWDVSKAVYVRSLFVGGTTGFGLSDMALSYDGTKLYVLTLVNDYIYQWNLSTAWDISTASYSQSLYVRNQDGSPSGINFKDDGTKLYITGYDNDKVYEYGLSTAWNVSTGSYSQSFSVASQEDIPSALYIGSSGSKLYVVGNTNDTVYEYGLSTAWDVSTASYSQGFSIASQDNLPVGLFFKEDGTKMYFIGSQNNRVYEYDLSTAWDVSTASYSKNVSIATKGTNPAGMYIGDAGSKLYWLDGGNRSVFQYDL